jgi:hypothetical protein
VLVLWLFDVALQLIEWLLSLFSFMPDLDFPAAFSVVVPVPLLTAGTIGALNEWWTVGVAVVTALVVGKVLQWIYARIPFKGT